MAYDDDLEDELRTKAAVKLARGVSKFVVKAAEFDRRQMKNIMAKKAIKTNELAVMCGVSENTVRNWLNGLHVPNINKFLKLVKALNVEYYTLLS